jgi:hypothetical protein
MQSAFAVERPLRWPLTYLALTIGLLATIQFGLTPSASETDTPPTARPPQTVAKRAPFAPNDIRRFSQHFLEANGDTAPWLFLPKENIKSINTSEAPGLVTIRETGKGQDIKGILKEPVRIGDYPLPWEFHLGLVQNSLAQKGLSEKQINYAIGLNIALTFSDPTTWPKDRTRLPPDTHSAQMFVVHLGNQGENFRPGVPRLKRTALNMYDHSPEVYLVYGRGDLAANLNGNWNMHYNWVGPDPADSGTWSKQGGPSDPFLRFRVQLVSPTSLAIGVGSGQHPGWRMRSIDVSRFGKITGIWEIGPIFSCDHWIPDVLARELRLTEKPAWAEGLKQRNKVLGKPAAENEALADLVKALTTVEPPDPAFEYYVDYAVFYGNGPQNIEHLSEDFNVPGLLADQKYYLEGNGICETHSNPGYLTVTLLGTNGSWAMCPILADSAIDFTKGKKPPFEIETTFITPDTKRPWNIWWNVGLYDDKGKFYPWQPGLKNIPGQGVCYFNWWSNDPDKIEKNPLVELTFDPELPQSLLAHQPLSMLLQVQDQHQLRIGFKANRADGWTFTKPFDASKHFGKIAKFAYPCLVSFQGGWVGKRAWGGGNYPGYQKFLIDYIYYRYPHSK